MSYKLSVLNGSGVPSLVEGLNREADWELKKQRLMKVWTDHLGANPERTDPGLEVHSEQQETDHVRLHISYATGYGDRVPAYLLIPGRSSHPEQVYPAVLALHPTDPLGKGDIASPQGRASRAYGLELVSRGFVVLAPDTITAGERIYTGEEAFRTAPFYREFPGCTAVGKMLHDHQQSLDLLEQLSYVDSDRIGAIGHSLGAYNSFFLAGMDRRIKAVVSSCGLSPFTQDPDPNRWGQRDWFSHIPLLSKDIERGEVPFEWHEIAALCAPTPMLQWMGQRDHIFPHWQAIAQASLELHSLYEMLGHKDKYVGLMGNAAHDFPEDIRQLAYRFLEQWLM